MIKQKRGASTLILFRSVELLLFGVAVLCLFFIMFNLSERTYEKDFIARDVALLINTIYAAPGDVEYTYDLSVFESAFDVEVKESQVFVYDPGFKGAQSYRFAEKHGVDIEEFKAESPTAMKFVKKEDGIIIKALY